MREPSIRARFVTRARYLQNDRGFRIAVEETVEAWNLAFPRFEIHSRGVPPDEPSRNGLRDIYPPSILRPPSTLGGDEREEVAEHWSKVVYEQCLRWWPTRYFPNWVDRFAHPARNFMSGCLIWSPRHVPEEWIDRVALAPREGPGEIDDPLAIENHPNVVFWKTLYWEVMQRIDATIKADPSFTITQLKEISRAADEVAHVARHEAGQVQTFRRYLPLFPGMSSTDLRENEKEIIEFANEGASIAHHVHTLSAEGMKILPIASLLGLSRRRVQQILEEE